MEYKQHTQKDGRMVRTKCRNYLKIVEKYSYNIFGEQFFIPPDKGHIKYHFAIRAFISFKNVWDSDVDGPKVETACMSFMLSKLILLLFKLDVKRKSFFLPLLII